ncbi:MAG: hypothetical protein ABIN96_09655, partial [Rubrivivax sp.]
GGAALFRSGNEFSRAQHGWASRVRRRVCRLGVVAHLMPVPIGDDVFHVVSAAEVDARLLGNSPPGLMQLPLPRQRP